MLLLFASVLQTRGDAATEDTKSYGDATSKNLIAPAAKKPLLHGKNEEPRSRAAPLSKWEKFLLSDERENSCGLIAPVQERLETPVKMLPSPGDKEASFMGITSSNWGPEPKQFPSILLDQISNTVHVETSNLPTGRSRETPVLASSLNLCNRLPEEPASVPSSNPPAVSDVKNLYKSLFSTGDDFDDYL